MGFSVEPFCSAADDAVDADAEADAERLSDKSSRMIKTKACKNKLAIAKTRLQKQGSNNKT